MNSNTTMPAKLHWSFWLICILGLIWNVMGFMNFFMQLSAEGISQMPASHQAIANARPDWVSASFGLSVIGGALGCLAMLFKKRFALLLLSLSFIATVVTISHLVLTNSITQAPINFGMAEILLAVAGPVIVSFFLFWYAKRAAGRGILK